MSVPDFYKILGVEKNTTPEELKKKYRALAKKHHPDANKGSKKAEENFKKISLAYETLKDDKKRREYDRKRAERARKKRSRPQQGARTSSSRYEGNKGYDFSDFQTPRDEEPFRSTGRPEDFTPDPNAPTRGFDLHLMAEVPFPKVVLGGGIKYHYEKYVNCSDCDGTGMISKKACPICNGKRQIVIPVSLDVQIPPGVVDQYTLRLENHGGEGRNGAPPGDLFLKICTEPHPHFKRLRNDILSEVKIGKKLAQNGGPLEVKTVDSVKTIQLEEDTLTGEEIRIPGQGAAIQWGKKRGDFVVKFLVSNEE